MSSLASAETHLEGSPSDSSQNEAHIPYSNFLVGLCAIEYTDALTLYSLLPSRCSN